MVIFSLIMLVGFIACGIIASLIGGILVIFGDAVVAIIIFVAIIKLVKYVRQKLQEREDQKEIKEIVDKKEE